MNCLAVDDEPLALNIVKDFCSKISFIKLVGTCTNAIQAVELIRENDINLLFLDIQMPHITGLEFIKTLETPPMVIFTTAYPEYALNGFDLNAVDYLVKPFSFERFIKAVQKAYDRFTIRKPVDQHVKEIEQPLQNYVMIKVEYSTVKVDLDKILYIEGLKDYVKIYAGGRPLLTKITMKSLEEKLPSTNFMRVHKSFIISLSKIDLIENNRIKINDKYIPVGNQYRTDFFKLIDKTRL